MIALLSDAHGNARIRAMKSRLKSSADLPLLRSVTSVSALAAALGLEPSREPARLPADLFGGLVADYEKVVATYRRGAPLLLALLRIHEVENVKLGWRARARGLPPERWIRLWRPFGRLETLSLACWRDADSLAHAVSGARGTPWDPILEETLRAHEEDAAAAELALDRWVWSDLRDKACRLPSSERLARDLVLARVRARDLDVLRRGAVSMGWTPELAIASTVLLRKEEKPEALRALATWAPDEGPLSLRVPPRLSRGLPPIADWDSWFLALARKRSESCRRAFQGPPFRLAPPLAYLMWKEEEVRALSTIARSRGVPEPPGVLSRVLAASPLEA